jgi:Protein of unknown function (DUF4235)
MKDKDKDKDKDNRSTKMLDAVTTMVAAFVARKLLILAWTKATGKEPPTNPEDPTVAMAEALGWSVLVGVTIAVVRVLAIRAVSHRTLSSADREPASVTKG